VRRLILTVSLLLAIAGCRDIAVEEMVADDYTYALDEDIAELGVVSDTPDTASGGEMLPGTSPSSSPTNQNSPMHAPGQRNASTAWFFNQPWAARVYWGKMLRDTIVLLVLTGIILFVTRVKREKDGKKGFRLEGGFLILAGAMVLLAGDSPVLNSALLSFSGIVLEALPFMVVGALLGGMIEVLLPQKTAMRLCRGRTRAVMIAAVTGIALPVCECAVIPVLYRLLRKGIPPEAGIAYMLAGPIVNPVSFTSTLVAYRFDWTVPLIRVLLGYIVAVTAALVIGALLRGRLVRKSDAGTECDTDDTEPDDTSFARVLRVSAEDLFMSGKYLIMGALLAGTLQAVVSRGTLLGLGGMPVPAILVMMLLAFVLSICADGDAFVAASFGKAFFPLSSQMAFMVLGPMLDIKLLLMYRMVFPRRTIVTLVIVVPVLVLLTSVLLHLVTGS
jgi:hypothetical protein